VETTTRQAGLSTARLRGAALRAESMPTAAKASMIARVSSGVAGYSRMTSNVVVFDAEGIGPCDTEKAGLLG
jgi:hypothetical protein